jgi:hypothetical protein
MNQPEKLRLLTPEELSGTAVVADGVEDLAVRSCRVRYTSPTGDVGQLADRPGWEALYGTPACAETGKNLTRNRSVGR